MTQKLLSSCEDVLYKKIMVNVAMTEHLKGRGFLLDVVEEPHTQDVQLIEVIDFGAMTGYGTCLSQPVRRAKLLYGSEDIDDGRVTI